MADRLPILVLAGSDSRPGAVPDGMQADQMLSGPKGTLELSSGRCLAAELVERIRSSGCFCDPLLVGPAAWYEAKVDCEVVNVKGTLVQTLREVSCTIQERFAGHEPIAITACDILPSADDFRELIRRCYEPLAGSVFWWQMIEAEPGQMGASAWKPAYRLPREPGGAPMTLYPGHLVIVRPDALRFQLVNRLLELAYRYRNRVLEKRYLGITMRAIGALIAQDIRNLARFQAPLLTFVLPYVGLRDYWKYRRGTVTLHDHEAFLTKAFLHRQFQRAATSRPAAISTTPLLSFAKDIDTKAELRELESARCTSE